MTLVNPFTPPLQLQSRPPGPGAHPEGLLPTGGRDIDQERPTRSRSGQLGARDVPARSSPGGMNAPGLMWKRTGGK